MEKEQQQFAFSVLRILDSTFFVEEVFEPKVDEVKIGYALAFHSNVEENWVQYNIRADFTIESTKVFASGTAVTKFGVVNMKSYVDSGTDVINWPPNTLETMFGIAFSHLRALMAKNIGATKYKDYIIPLINPANLFKQLIENHPHFKGIAEPESDNINQQTADRGIEVKKSKKHGKK